MRVARLRRDADSKLRSLTDEEFDRGLDRLRTAVAADPAARATSWLDRLVLA